MTSRREPETIKAYHRRKLATGVSSSVFVFLLLATLVVSGLSRTCGEVAEGLFPHPVGALIVFTLMVGALYLLVTIPFHYYSGYILEHRYGLSSQSFGRWVLEQAKGLAISLPLGLGAVVLAYVTLERFGMFWWIPAGIVAAVVSVVLAQLAPLVILPIFYRLRPLEATHPLRPRIESLCREAGITIRGIVTFDLSTHTHKANAAFTGIGPSRRILLGDTLLAEFTEEEITTVVAHELGHAVGRHLVRGIATGVVLSFAVLALSTLAYGWSLRQMGFAGLTDLPALPLLALWIGLLSTAVSPLGHLQSRSYERQADRYAVRATGNKRAYLEALRKLQVTNLADPAPHPVVEALFYSHPSMAKRIAMVNTL